jgi:hypothetical protein
MSKKPWLIPLLAMAIPQLFMMGVAYGVISIQVETVKTAVTNIANIVKENGEIMRAAQLVTVSHSSELRHHEQRIKDLELLK